MDFCGNIYLGVVKRILAEATTAKQCGVLAAAMKICAQLAMLSGMPQPDSSGFSFGQHAAADRQLAMADWQPDVI